MTSTSQTVIGTLNHDINRPLSLEAFEKSIYIKKKHHQQLENLLPSPQDGAPQL